MVNEELVRNVLDAYYRRGIDYVPEIVLETNLKDATHEERVEFLHKFGIL